ncbi:MAG: hypothetical protein ACI3VQ_07305 [Faecousia sp.]
MPETEKKEQTPAEEQLSPKKKRAMLEYMGIMFAVAFLLVAVSLIVKIHFMQDDLEAANYGASENIAAMESLLETADAEREEASRSAKASELLLLAQDSFCAGDEDAFRAYMDELSETADALPETAVVIYEALLREL